MNEMNELETQLRSWAPRRPSARISRALFGREALARFRRERELKASHSSAFLLNWLAPAVAAVALMFAFFHLSSNSARPTRSVTAPMIAVILSNQSFASVLFEASNREPATSIHRGFDVRSTQPKAFGVATSGVSTGASERLPDWPSQPQMEERSGLPATNGTGVAPQAAMPPVGFKAGLCAARERQSAQRQGLLVCGSHCPEVRSANSPTFQRWETYDQPTACPEGTVEINLQSLNRPSGTEVVLTGYSTLKRYAIFKHPSGINTDLTSDWSTFDCQFLTDVISATDRKSRASAVC